MSESPQSQRRSGFGSGFAKDVEAILFSEQRGHLYRDEVRENLRIAGMVLGREAEMPDFGFTEDFDPELTDYEGVSDGD